MLKNKYFYVFKEKYMNFIIFKYLYQLFLLLIHKIAWCKVNGPIQLALRSKIIILKIFLVLESYMSIVIMRITTPGIRIP